MTNTVFFSTILVVILLGVVSVGLRRLIYKKGITFYAMAIMMVPLILYAIAGFVGGVKGHIHFLWAAPLALFCSLFAFGKVGRMIERPLNEMKNVVSSLSEGNVNVTYDEKFKKGDHELAQVMRLLSKLAASLKRIAAFADNVGKGNLHVEYTLLGENDILGNAMLNMRSNLLQAEAEKEERQREDERRNWAAQGVAKFAELLRANNDNIEELCHSIIKNLVKYIGANQGAIFILNDDDAKKTVLEMKACYAYERRKFANKTIEPGDGLVGTCYLEGESVYMTDLPKKYIRITSGLGKDTPRALLIVPLKVNGAIYGIIEIAAFKEFEPHVQEFVEKVSESIASTIGAVKVNIQTGKLLAKTKLQAEEMANQEEELRQNLEEMQSTQDEMRRRETELAEALSANENQMTKLGLIIDAYETGLWEMNVVKGDPVNPNNEFIWSDEFRQMLGYSSEADFPNVLHSWSDKLHPDDKQRTLDAFARHLLDRTGKTPYDIEYRLLKKNGEYAEFHAFGATVRDEEGFALQVIGAIKDITEEKKMDEEMRRREIELQETLEKMRAVQVEEEEKEFELQQFYNAIVESNNVGVFSADGIVIDVNQNLLDLWEVEKSVFMGKHYSLFVGEEGFATVWKDMVQGKKHADVRTITSPSGRQMVFRHNFIPVCNKQGELMRVLLLAFPEKDQRI